MSGPIERFGRTELPAEQKDALRTARRLAWISIAFLASGIAAVALVMGSSQAMKVAWIEDLLSLVPPIMFLVGARSAVRPPSQAHPWGHHRTVASAHLAASVALFAMGAFTLVDSAMGLLKAEHPPIGSFHVFGQTIWAGWFMIAAMVYTGIGPVILGRLKLPLSEQLHDKVLQADADMNKADWMTAGAAIVGVLGIGIGWWWADAVAALVIAVSILRDGIKGVRGSLRDLMDGEARTYDDAEVHPLVGGVLAAAQAPNWVADAGVRVRDMGHVFHAEVFVVPTEVVSVAELEGLRDRIRDLDWKLNDVVVAPVSQVPDALRR